MPPSNTAKINSLKYTHCELFLLTILRNWSNTLISISYCQWLHSTGYNSDSNDDRKVSDQHDGATEDDPIIFEETRSQVSLSFLRIVVLC